MHHTLIDAYELRASYDLPDPVVETYRPNYVTPVVDAYRASFATPRQSYVALTSGPRMSLDLEVDVEFDDDEPSSDSMIEDPAPSSTRWTRARTWDSE